MEKARAASSGYREGRGRKGGEDPFEWNEVRLGEDGKGEGKGGGEGGRGRGSVNAVEPG